MVMATRYGNHIDKNGLVLYFDAAYPGSAGSSVPDLSGTGNNGTWINGSLWSSAYGGVFQFNASNVLRSPVNVSSGTSTVIGSSRYTGANTRRIISATNNNWLLGHWQSSVENFFSEGWVTAAGAGPNDQSWRIYAGTSDVPNDSYAFYINGVLNTGPNVNGAAGVNGLSLGNSGLYGESSNGEVGFVMIYTRILTLVEIQTITSFMKGRYGIS